MLTSRIQGYPKQEGGSFSPDKSGTRWRTCSCFSRIHVYGPNPREWDATSVRFHRRKMRRRRSERCAELTSRKFARAICGSTNHRNKGLISVNRRTSLLSHVQYPVPIKVVYKGFNALSARKAIMFGVGPEPIATREHREQIYRRFPAWILT